MRFSKNVKRALSVFHQPGKISFKKLLSQNCNPDENRRSGNCDQDIEIISQLCNDTLNVETLTAQQNVMR